MAHTVVVTICLVSGGRVAAYLRVVRRSATVITVVNDAVPLGVVQEDEVGDAAPIGVHKAYAKATVTRPVRRNRFGRRRFRRTYRRERGQG